MSRILCLAPSGFGKTSGLGQIVDEKAGIKMEGLIPKETFLISVTSKPLPWFGSGKQWITNTIGVKGEKVIDPKITRRLVSNNPQEIADQLTYFAGISAIKNVVWDDANYVMQDYYMDNALVGGWDKMCVLFSRN